MTTAHPSYADSARRWFGRAFSDLDRSTRRALAHASDRRVIATAPGAITGEPTGWSERTADAVARFGGSWAFIGIFAAFLVAWSVINALLPRATAFDPYPFIFLNLILSMVAALQAPFIMMSQNRQAAKDRQMAIYDYEVNVKAEIEIMALHDKLDALRHDHTVLLETLGARIETLAAALTEARQTPPAGQP
ncbi:MAG: hypothetical protein AMXMBFR59_25970 [Rhodanobacteraceae bacterium]